MFQIIITYKSRPGFGETQAQQALFIAYCKEEITKPFVDMFEEPSTPYFQFHQVDDTSPMACDIEATCTTNMTSQKFTATAIAARIHSAINSARARLFGDSLAIEVALSQTTIVFWDNSSKSSATITPTS